MGRTAVLAVLFPGTRDEGARVMPRLSPCGERRLLQWSVAVLALVPVLAGGAGVASGLSLFGVRANLPLGGDSHVRYLSGLILGVGLGFWSTVPRIEIQGARFRALTGVVLIGGLARLYALARYGVPPRPMLAALVMELAVTPGLAVWRERVERRLARGRCSRQTLPGRFARKAARATPCPWSGATKA